MARNHLFRPRARQSAARTHALRNPGTRTLRCQRLEDRRLLAVVTVDTDQDVVDFDDGMTSLREAIFATNLVAGPDEIRFDFGHDGPATILLTQGELAISDSLTISGPGAELLTIDASGNDPTPDQNKGDGSRAFFIDDGSTQLIDVQISGLNLTGGDPRISNDWGGAIHNRENLLIGNCIIAGNSGRGGGGVYSTNGSLEILHCVFVNNVAERGGGIAIGGDGLIPAASITNSLISGNHAETGGGVWAGLLQLTITDSEITDNSADSSGGGGVAAIGDLRIINSTIAANQAARGGGIHASGSLLISGSTVSGNEASDEGTVRGGGIYSGHELTLVNSTVSGNSVQSAGDNSHAYGGGIFALGNVRVAHSTVVGNTAFTLGAGATASGGGIFAGADARSTIDHSIIAGNLTTDGEADFRIEDGALTARFSLIGDNQGTALAEAPVGTPDADGNLVGGSIFGFIDPGLGPLTDNGGPTATHALVDGSPAIFAGDLTLTPGVGNTPEFDQRGAPFSRRVGTRIDLGAVEHDLAPFVVDTLVDESDGDYSTGDFSLREAILLANSRAGFDAIEFDPNLFAASAATIVLTHGELVIAGSLDLRGPGSSLLTIDASGNDPTPGGNPTDGTSVMSIGLSGQIAIVFVTGLTVTGGARGGIVSSVDLTLTDVDVTANTAIGSGGAGITASQLAMQASRVTHNESGPGAGGIWVSGPLVMVRSTISDNHSMRGFGAGGIEVGTGFGSIPGDVFIAHSTISNNSSARGAGGIHIVDRSLTLTDSTVSGNAGFEGGGLRLIDADDIDIRNSAILNNTASFTGGGIRIRGVGFGAHSIENSTISGNAAAEDGGGLAIGGAFTPTLVRHSTVAGNVADSDGNGIGAGGGILGSNLLLDHTIVAQNTLGSGSLASDVLRNGAAPINAAHSLIGNNAGSNLTEAPIGSPDANGNLIGGPVHGLIDPLLGPQADNGGPTLTHALLPGSPAVDAGDAALVAGVGGVPEFDQRGAPFARVVGTRIDIGAVERRGVPLVVDTLADESDGDHARGDVSLREAIELAIAQEGADVIVFDPGLFASGAGTILLTHGELAITSSLTVDGPGAELLTIDASGNDPTPFVRMGDGIRAFNVDNGDSELIDVTIAALKITGGDVLGDGGAIRSVERLTVDHSVIDRNFARGMTGTRAYGGGIYSAGHLVVRDTEVRQSIASLGGGIAAIGDGLGAEADSIQIIDCMLIGNPSGGLYVGTTDDAVAVIQGGWVFSNNSSLAAGGVTLSSSGNSSITLDDVEITQNLASNGGGLSIGAAHSSRVQILRSYILNNRVSGGAHGGGLYMYLEDRASVTVADSVISGNTSTRHGGGLYIIADGFPTGGAFTISNTSITNNSASESGGGILMRADGASTYFTDVEIQGNSAGDDGGGLLLDMFTSRASTISMNRTDVSNNWAGDQGGGVFAGRTSSPSSRQLTIANSLIHNNTANGHGGGIAAEIILNLENSTITGNSATSRAGVSAPHANIRHSTITDNISLDLTGLATTGGFVGAGLIEHSIVAGNHGPLTVNDVQRSFGSLVVHHSLIGHINSPALPEAPVGSPDAYGNLIGGPMHGTIDPLLGPLADNGGPTLTHALLPGSPAINAGDAALAPGVGGVPEFDQRGAPFTRWAGRRVDIGAFEAQAAGGGLTADFDLDGLTSGGDFLVWQRNLGRESAATVRHGDATADGDVDGSDLAVWMSQFGAGASAAAAMFDSSPNNHIAAMAGAGGSTVDANWRLSAAVRARDVAWAEVAMASKVVDWRWTSVEEMREGERAIDQAIERGVVGDAWALSVGAIDALALDAAFWGE